MSEPITRARLAALPPAEAAALWRIQQDQGSPVEAGLFEEWLGQDEANRDAWDAVSGAWALFDDAGDPEFAELRRAALADRPPTRWYDVRHHWRPAAAAAAVVLAVVAGGVEFGRNHTGPSAQLASNAGAGPVMQVYETSSGGSQEVALADGTRMSLAPDARVQVMLAADRRQLALERGAVTLAVAHDAARPFQVSAQGRRIIDVGTRFQVALESGAMRVALYEGAVRVEGGTATTVLRPGQQLVARPGRRDVITRIAANDAGGPEQIQLDNVTLASAAETINQGSALKLAMPDPKVAQLRVSGRFRAADPERFASSVSVLLSLRIVHIGPTSIELRRRR